MSRLRHIAPLLLEGNHHPAAAAGWHSLFSMPPAQATAEQLKQWAKVVVAHAGAVVQTLAKVNIETLCEHMTHQLKEQMSIVGKIVLPDGVSWDQIVGKHILKPRTAGTNGVMTLEGHSEWKEWQNIKRWVLVCELLGCVLADS